MATAKLLTLEEAADLLRMTARRLKRRAKKREIPCISLPAGEYRFDEDDLLEWIASCKQPSAEASAT